MNKRPTRKRAPGKAVQELPPIYFMIPFALPWGDDEALKDQQSHATNLARLIAAWRGAMWKPWESGRSVMLHVPRSLGGLATMTLSTMNGDTHDTMRLFHLARRAAYCLSERGNTRELMRLAELGNYINDRLSIAGMRFPKAVAEAKSNLAAWPVKMVASGPTPFARGRIPPAWADSASKTGAELGEALEAWGLRRDIFSDGKNSTRRAFAVGIIGMINMNRDLFLDVKGDYDSLAKHCKSVGTPLRPPVWYKDVVELPDLSVETWTKWRDFITRAFVLSIIPNFGSHPAWGKNTIENYNRQPSNIRDWDKMGRKSPINRMLHDVKQEIARCLVRAKTQ